LRGWILRIFAGFSPAGRLGAAKVDLRSVGDRIFGYQDLLEAHAGRDERRANLTMENGLAAFETALDVNNALMNDNAVAAQFGVKLLAYETGPSTGVTRELGLGERDPRFRRITVDGLNSWFAVGGHSASSLHSSTAVMAVLGVTGRSATTLGIKTSRAVRRFPTYDGNLARRR